jgi:hypothetical protein
MTATVPLAKCRVFDESDIHVLAASGLTAVDGE